MAYIDTSSKKETGSFKKGNPLYIILLTLVATLGGLLFGYDTAVVNGAEKSLVEYYIYKSAGSAYEYVSDIVSVVNQYQLLLSIVMVLIFVIITGQIVKLLGKKKGLMIGGAILLIVLLWVVRFMSKPVPSDPAELKDTADAIKGFVIASALIGCVIGGSLAGFISRSVGRKNGLVIAAVAFFISAIGAWRPESFNFFGLLDVYSFVIYRIVGGIGVGIASMISPMYIAEIAPAKTRGKLVSFNQFAIIFGMLIIYFVNYFIAKQGDDQWLTETGWRWMFFSGAIPAGIFLILLFFIPETPRYLVLKDKEDKARSVLNKIAGEEQASKILLEIKATLHEHHAPWMSYGFMVIFIGIMLSVFQQFVGINVVLYYSANIFRDMGAKTDASLLSTIYVGIVNLSFTVIAILTVDKFGRKPLMIIGALVMAVAMISLGTAFYMNLTEEVVNGATVTRFASAGAASIALFLILLYIAGFAMSWGPVTWVMLSEIFPNSIRGAMSIAVAAQWIANWIVSLTFPIMNDSIWLNKIFNHGFSYWIYGLMGILAALFMWKLVPETKGKSLEEMEHLWKK